MHRPCRFGGSDGRVETSARILLSTHGNRTARKTASDAHPGREISDTKAEMRAKERSSRGVLLSAFLSPRLVLREVLWFDFSLALLSSHPPQRIQCPICQQGLGAAG